MGANKNGQSGSILETEKLAPVFTIYLGQNLSQ